MIRTIQKEIKLAVLIHKLDKRVSEVVRRSAADDRGYVLCISCPCKVHWSEADCAHFIDRGHMNTRFNLLNLAPSCRFCNRLDEDHHKTKWAEKLGPDMVAYLEAEGRSLRKLMRYELEKGIELMSQKLNELR